MVELMIVINSVTEFRQNITECKTCYLWQKGALSALHIDHEFVCKKHAKYCKIQR
jgi:hypothetical protein